jgi:outer membrane protein assembly factor BamB
VLQRDKPADKNDSYLLCLEAKTGKEIWRRARPSQAREESRESFTTPVVATIGDKRQLLVIGGDDLTGHDLESGAELWRWGTWNPERIGHWRHVPSPVAGDGIVLVCAPKRDPIYAIRPAGEGSLGDDAIAWVSREARALTSDVPTPAFADGDFFVLSDVRKSVSRVDPQSGKAEWTTDLPGDPKYEASPLVADGKIYVINFHGQLVTLDAKTGKVLSNFDTEATREYPVRSSVIAAAGQLFVRTNRKLLAIGKKTGAAE